MASLLSTTASWVFTQPCIAMHVGIELGTAMWTTVVMPFNWHVAIATENISVFCQFGIYELVAIIKCHEKPSI